jgi:hypothetical protein
MMSGFSIRNCFVSNKTSRSDERLSFVRQAEIHLAPVWRDDFS